MRKCLETVNKFSNDVGYRINSHKSVSFLLINNKHTEKQIMDTLSFLIAQRKIKHLRINLAKPSTMKSLEERSRKMLEIGRVSHAHGLAVTVVKMTILPQLFRDSVWYQSRTPHLILHGNKSKHYLKIYMEQQRPQITQTNLSKMDNAGITILDFKIYYNSLVINSICCRYKNRQANGTKLKT